MSFSVSRAGCALVAGLALGAALPAETDVANTVPVVLQEFNVQGERELPPMEEWHYTRIAGQEVLSNLSRGRTERIARDLTELLHALELSGTRLLPANAPALRIVIVDSNAQFGGFAPRALESGTEDPETAVIGRPEQPLLVINAAALSLDFSRANQDESEQEADNAALPVVRRVNAARLLQLGYLRARLAQPRPPLPPWLIEGVAQVLVWARVTENSITLGQVENPNESGSGFGVGTDREPGRVVMGDLQHHATFFQDSLSAERDFNTALARSALFSMEELLTGDLQKFSGVGNAAQRVRWQKQCHAFVHWGLFGDYGRNSAQFLAFTRRLRTEALSEALFKECFGRSYAEGLQALRTHIELTRGKVHGVQVGKGEKLPPAAPVEVRPATLLEIARLKARAYTDGGQFEKARDELILAYRRGERSPDLVAELGLIEEMLGRHDRAARYLTLAVNAKTTRIRAYLQLASLRLQERLAQPQGKGGKLSYEQLLGVLEPLLLARQQPTRSAEVYKLLASTWRAAETPPPAPHLAVLDEGVKLFPQDEALREARAQWPATPAAQP